MATTPTKPATKATTTAEKPVAARPKTAPTAIAKKPVVKVKPEVKAKSEIKAKPAEAQAKKVEKEKAPKLKMERDSFTMPKAEYAQIYILKDKLIKLGQPAKKSELLRAGLMLLSAMDDEKLKATMAKIPAIKTGRPKK